MILGQTFLNVVSERMKTNVTIPYSAEIYSVSGPEHHVIYMYPALTILRRQRHLAGGELCLLIIVQVPLLVFHMLGSAELWALS